jgi:hypothetical protein
MYVPVVCNLSIASKKKKKVKSLLTGLFVIQLSIFPEACHYVLISEKNVCDFMKVKFCDVKIRLQRRKGSKHCGPSFVEVCTETKRVHFYCFFNCPQPEFMEHSRSRKISFYDPEFTCGLQPIKSRACHKERKRKSPRKANELEATEDT